MRGLNNTIARLKAMRHYSATPTEPTHGRLVPFKDFRVNPGRLNAWAYIPDRLPRNAPLVVVLHGCTQSASGYDRGCGWSTAADHHGFALLFPEQQRSNNPNLCFNWFSPEDASRGHGEALSIREMVAGIQARYGTDPEQVFVTGLSAGGAMAAVMLATYPEVFAGGAIIAGLPFGTARSVPEAFDRMRGHADATPDMLAAKVQTASSHDGPWPVVSVWHGTNDTTVDASNARATIDQWRTLHGLGATPPRVDTVNGFVHRVWKDAGGRGVIEEYVIAGMGHGTPLSTSADYGESAGPFMLDVGISSTHQILTFWGVANGLSAAIEERSPEGAAEEAMVPSAPQTVFARASADGSTPKDLQNTIETALRAAGLIT